MRGAGNRKAGQGDDSMRTDDFEKRARRAVEAMRAHVAAELAAWHSTPTPGATVGEPAALRRVVVMAALARLDATAETAVADVRRIARMLGEGDTAAGA